jgi:hypothetical protein
MRGLLCRMARACIYGVRCPARARASAFVGAWTALAAWAFCWWRRQRCGRRIQGVNFFVRYPARRVRCALARRHSVRRRACPRAATGGLGKLALLAVAAAAPAAPPVVIREPLINYSECKKAPCGTNYLRAGDQWKILVISFRIMHVIIG